MRFKGKVALITAAGSANQACRNGAQNHGSEFSPLQFMKSGIESPEASSLRYIAIA